MGRGNRGGRGGAVGGRGRGARAVDTSKELQKHFSAQYPCGRWTRLQAALLAPVDHVAVENPFAAHQQQRQQQQHQQEAERWASCAAASTSSGSHSRGPCSDAGLVPYMQLGALRLYKSPRRGGPYLPPPFVQPRNVRAWYWLDLASLLPVLLLRPTRGQQVLDMCAAPGGKSILIAQSMWSPHKQTDQQHADSSGGQAPQLPSPSQPALPSQTHPDSGADVPTPAYDQEEALSESALNTLPGSLAAALAHTRTSASGAGKQGSGSGISSTGHMSSEAEPGLMHHLQQLSGLGGGRLVSNESDQARCARLASIVTEYLPLEQRPLHEVTNQRGQLFWARQQAASYDRVLVDAPCTSERHVLQQAAARGASSVGGISSVEWSLAGVRQTAALQVQLCMAAVHALKPGGILVYSTCSLAEEENDGVLRMLMQRHPGAVQLLDVVQELHASLTSNGSSCLLGSAACRGSSQQALEASMQAFGLERTALGAISLPDVAGAGPIYVSVMRKVGELARPGASLMMAHAGLQLDEDEESEDEGALAMQDAEEGQGNRLVSSDVDDKRL